MFVSFSLLLRSLLLLLLLSSLILRCRVLAALAAARGDDAYGGSGCRALVRIPIGDFADHGAGGRTSRGASYA